jgi:predicted nuclease with TOPRIM domain
MKFLLSILVIIDNLNVLLANNDNCRENDLNALMVRLRQLRTEFNNLKIQHEEQIDRIDQINATQSVLKEANDTQERELKTLRQEFNFTSSELEDLRQNTSSEIAAIKGIL